MPESAQRPPHPSTWLFYDGRCRHCRRIVRRLTGPLARRGIYAAPFQRGWVQERLDLPVQACPDRIHLLTGEGEVLAGRDAVVFLAARFAWAMPLALVARVPGAMALLSRLYVVLTRHRHGGAKP